jgi:Cd2+/Zn2+-exporting ATPase
MASHCCQPQHDDKHDHGHDHGQASHDHNHEHEHDHNHDHSHSHSHALPTPQTKSAAAKDAEEAIFVIQKMDCPTEEKLIRAQLTPMHGIVDMQFNLLGRELTVQHNLPSIAPIVATLSAIDMAPKVKSDSLDASAFSDEVPDFSIPRSKWIMVGIAGLAAIGAEIMAWTTGTDNSWPVMALALFAILLGGLGTLKKGWIALRHLSLNMNFLMSIAVIGAAIIGQWPEAAMVIVLFTLAEMIEALSLDRARNAISGLLALSPDTATVQDISNPGNWTTIAAKNVTVGTIVRIKPGERLPLDGIVTSGQSTINQAPITGESMPVTKQAGDTVFTGTINEQGSFQYRVTAVQSESTLSRIVKSVQQAQGQRAPTQRFVDQFARYYIPAVVLLALLIAIVPPLALGAEFYPWLYKALVLLVIACPCALVISTPVTIVSGLACAARNGILIKGGAYLEQGRKLRHLAVDKTGTITAGKPIVTDLLPLGSNTDTTDLLRHAASLSSRSDHPVSSAIASFWHAEMHTVALFDVSNFEALTGRGTTGIINGQTYHLGNHRMVHELGMCSPALENTLQQLEKQGKTTTVLCRNNVPQLMMAVADTVRPTSKSAIADLQSLGVNVVMLTGDNSHTANAIAASVGIIDARGDQLPDDKLQAVTALGNNGEVVGMVGDGINDAPALAKANIGFAMGAAGTDTAIETADVALMDDDLNKLPFFMRLSARTHRVLLQNITFALGIKALFLILALTGEATLWMAVFADMGASLLVVFNGLRLLRAPRIPLHVYN